MTVGKRITRARKPKYLGDPAAEGERAAREDAKRGSSWIEKDKKRFKKINLELKSNSKRMRKAENSVIKKENEMTKAMIYYGDVYTKRVNRAEEKVGKLQRERNALVNEKTAIKTRLKSRGVKVKDWFD